MEIVLLAWVLMLATMWLARILAEEMWAAVRGQTSPRIARRRAREHLARECGTPTIGQAVAFRVARRIADPPRRRWAADLRCLLDEVWADALAEARVRHQHAHEARVRARRARQNGRPRPPRGQGWQARTGGHQPPPQEDETAATTRPCRECRRVFVVEPEELCTSCELATAEPPPRPPDPTPDPDLDDLDDEQITDEQEPITMTAVTHTINGDVRDPRTALAFADSCRGFNDAIVAELEILTNNMAQAKLGPDPLAAIKVIADAARAYSASNRKSVKAYAAHVVTQAEIAGDADLRETVDRTYLDTRGSDASTAPKSRGMTRSMSAADCRYPSEGARFMTAVSDAYSAMRASVDQTKSNHHKQGITGQPMAFLAEQLEFASTLHAKAARAADTFRRHAARVQDTVGKDESLHGTQRGRYLDPTKV